MKLAAGLPLLLLGVGIRLWALGDPSLWLDEGFTHYVSSKPFQELLRYTSIGENHPPLYYLALHLWMMVAGQSEYAMRYLSVWAGVAAVALTLSLGHRLVGFWPGVAAAALLAVSPLHVSLSQEARMYSPLMAIALMSALLFWQAWKQPTFLRWALYAISGAAMMLTHYNGILVFAGHSLAALILMAGARRWRWDWMAAQVGGSLLFLPWLLAVWRQQIYQATSGTALDEGFLPVIWRLAGQLGTGEGPHPAGYLAPYAGGLLIALLAAGVWMLHPRPALALLGAWMVAPLLLPYLAQAVLGGYWRFGGARYALVLLPAVLLLATAALRGHRPIIRAAPLVALLSISVAALAAQQAGATKEQFREAAQFVMEREGAGETIILNAEHIYPAFAYYYTGALEWQRAESGSPDKMVASLERQTAGHCRVWLVLSHEWVSDPEGQVERWFNSHGLKIDERWLAGIHVFQYLLEPRPNMQAPPVGTALDASFGGLFRLAGHDMPASVTAGEALRLPLVWQSLAPTGEDHQAVFVLLDGKGRSASQTDRRPIVWHYGSSRWQPGEYLSDLARLPVPLGTPPGEYQVAVIIYAPSTGQRLAAAGPQALGDRVLLGSVRVERPAQPLRSLPAAWQAEARNVNPDLRLLEGQMGAGEVWAGGSLPVTLVWQARRAPTVDYQPRLELVAANGAVIARHEGLPVDGTYPTSSWQAGEIVREMRQVAVPARAVPGQMELRLLVGGQALSLGTVQVKAPERSYQLPATARPLSAEFGSQVRLAGYEMASSDRSPGSPLRLVLYWRALQPMEESYTVFAHLLDGDGKVAAQMDGLPAGGSRPTTSWMEGEFVRDEREIKLPATAGKLRVEVGLYLAATGGRLLLPDGQSQVLLDEVVEVAPR